MQRLGLIAAVALLAFPLLAQQQENSAPPPNAPAPAQKKADSQKAPPKKSEAEQNPFPLAQSEAAAQGTQQGNAPAAAPQPHTSTPSGQARPSTAGQNPFPESQSQAAARREQQADHPAPAPATEKPGSTGDFSSSQLQLQSLAPGDTENKDGITVSAALGKQDTQVGLFYLQTGDYKGAYDRFFEATHADPGNADAVYGLADAARHLNRREEALRYYRLYLSALPDGPRAKDVRKALKEMGASPHS